MSTVSPNILSDFSSGGTAPAAFHWAGGDGYLFLQGTIGSATFQQQVLGPDGVTYMNLGSAVAAVGISTFTAPPCMMKIVPGGTGGSHLYLRITPKRTSY